MKVKKSPPKLNFKISCCMALAMSITDDNFELVANLALSRKDEAL